MFSIKKMEDLKISIRWSYTRPNTAAGFIKQLTYHIGHSFSIFFLPSLYLQRFFH